jgi:hypothetical protein
MELVIAQSLALDLSDDDVRKALGKDFDFAVSEAARLLVASRKAGRVYEAIFETITLKALAGEKVYLSGLGVFGLSESEGPGAGAVIPIVKGGGPLLPGMDLVDELQEASELPGNWAGGSAGLYQYVQNFDLNTTGSDDVFTTFSGAGYQSPVIPASGVSDPGWWLTSAGRQKVRITCSGDGAGPGGRFFDVGGLPVVEYGTVQRVMDNVVNGYWLTVEAADISAFWARWPADYLKENIGYWLPIGSENLPMMEARQAEAWRYKTLYGLTVAQVLAGFPRVVKRVRSPAPGGSYTFNDVEWLSGDEFRERFRWSKDSLIAQGCDWPELPAKRNKNTRMVCRFDDAFKSEVGLSVIE